MKKLSIIALNLFVAASVLLTSCGDKTEEKKGASASFLGDEGYVTTEKTLAPGEGFIFGLAITKGDAKMTTLTLRRDAELKDLGNVTIKGLDEKTDLAINPIALVGGNDETIQVVFGLNAEQNAGTYTYSVSITDKNAITTVKSIKIIVAGSLAEKTGQFFNINSAALGAYDLVAGANLASTADATSKDMVNTDASTATGSTFTGSFESKNATLFVKTTGFDYAKATGASIKTAFDAGTSSVKVASPAVDDIYVVKLRGGDSYAVIKVTSVEPTFSNGGSGKNNGKIVFSYKK